MAPERPGFYYGGVTSLRVGAKNQLFDRYEGGVHSRSEETRKLSPDQGEVPLEEASTSYFPSEIGMREAPGTTFYTTFGGGGKEGKRRALFFGMTGDRTTILIEPLA